MTIKVFYFIYLFEIAASADEVMMEKRPWNEALQAFVQVFLKIFDVKDFAWS